MDAVVALDLGTTHIKWVVVGENPQTVLWQGQTSAETTIESDRSEQDPEHVLRQVEDILARAARYGTVRRLAFSAAMHSCLAVDSQGRPLTPSLTC